MEKTYNYVYVTTNMVNNKQYVGDHSTNNLNDGYLGSGLYLRNSIKKYGKEKFKKEILEFFGTKQEAFDSQIIWINKFTTLTPNGYNISPNGGYGNKKCYLSDETKNKISKNNSKFWLGKKMSDESKEKNRKKHLNKITSDETKSKISNSLLGISKSKESIKKSRISRRKVSNDEIDHIIKLKHQNISANETCLLFKHISIRCIFAIRSGKYKKI